MDDVTVQSWLYALRESPLVDEDFNSSSYVFTQENEESDVSQIDSERGESIELVDNRNGALQNSFASPAPDPTTRLVIRWAWRELSGDDLDLHDYILAEYSDDGSTWDQMGVIGFSEAPREFVGFGAVPPDDVLGGELWIRFIAPSSAENGSSEGALIDDVIVGVDSLTDIFDTFDAFVDNGDGTYSTTVTNELDGRRVITCRYQCGDGEEIVASFETTL